MARRCCAKREEGASAEGLGLGGELTDEFWRARWALWRGGKEFSEPYMFGLGLGAYAAWVSGTVVGAYAGGGALEGWPLP